MHHKLFVILSLIVVVTLLSGIAITPQGGIVAAQGPQPQGIAVALGTGFTYQGQLKKNGNAVNDNTCSMTFSLWDSASGGAQVGGNQTLNPVVVANGLFTVQLNGGNQFGASAFNGNDRWLQITVQCASDGGSTTTLSRQHLTAAPYALFSAAPWVTNGNSVYYTNGNVGIGTVNQTAKLDVRIDDLQTPAIHGGNPSGKGVVGESTSDNGVFGISTSFNGVAGQSTSGRGVLGVSEIGVGVYGESFYGWAGQFNGRVQVMGPMTVTGYLAKQGGGFLIDHPLDPANQYLNHSFVESPDMKNVYDGNVTLDTRGEATVILPDYFEALNHDFRYQLTAIGAPGPNLYIAEEIQNNRFKIAGGKAGAKVSWQVTGIRHDPWAEQNRRPAEMEKAGQERGKYLYPQGYGQPDSMGVDYEMRRPLERPTPGDAK